MGHQQDELLVSHLTVPSSRCQHLLMRFLGLIPLLRLMIVVANIPSWHICDVSWMDYLTSLTSPFDSKGSLAVNSPI